MNNAIKALAKEIAQIIRESGQKKTAPYDTQATVKRIEKGTAWVQIPGGVDETPVRLTIDAKEGDNVQVRVANGRAWLTGNGTAPPTDNAKANEANENAKSASVAARAAFNAAENAQTDAERAHYAAEQAETDASEAKISAAEAKTSATNASEYASRALGNLSTVQSVVETLNWITAHGTMTLTTDTELDPSHVYFVLDENGDYVVGNVHYSIVAEPKETDLSSYYVLAIDESLNNYVATHLALTDEGLWILPEGMSANSYRILIATGGQGHTYEDAGTYIIDSAGKIVAKLGEAITLGIDDGTQSHIELDYHSMRMISKEGDDYMHISDLRDESGEAVVSDGFATDGIKRTFYLSRIATNTNYEVTGEYQGRVTKETTYFTLETPPSPGKYIIATYSTRSPFCKAYTLGRRLSESPIGVYSFAEGYEVEASGTYSHAEGANTGAVGRCSHAEGDASGAHGYASHAEGIHSRANGDGSHAQNTYTIAAKESQSVIGKYNKEDTESDPQKQKAFIIGNGTSDSNRSNAFTADWSGNVWAAGSVTENNGTRDIDLNISEATIALYDALAGGTSWRE